MILRYLIEKEFKQLARNKIIPRMLVALPLMAMLVFPWAANLEIKNVRVDVVDNDHSPLSQRLVAEIGGSAYFNISGTSDSYPDALRKVDSDEADDFVQLALLLQHVHDLLHHGGPVGVHFLIEPGLQTVQIQGI